jgi:hypothetical protein
VTLKRLIALSLLLIASAWVALVNGQPLFSLDSATYVRGPDFAIVYFLGPKFATSWTQERTFQGLARDQGDKNNESKNASGNSEVRLNSPFDKMVLAGRSFYYGALLYLGHLSSYFWLTVFAQAAIFLYLSYTLTVACLRLSFCTFVCVTSIILVASPLSFFIGFLMPDVFASFLILGLTIFVGFFDSLKLRDQTILMFIILYSAIAHTSHLLVLIVTGSIFAAIVFFGERTTPSFYTLRGRLMVLLALCLTGLLGDFAVSYGVRHTVGAEPIQPPFLMARLIADGPGYKFLQNNCANGTYAACKFMDRLPVASSVFLWSTDPTEGVFRVADLPTQIALSSQQMPFAFDVLRFDPVGVTTAATRDFLRQFFRIDLDAFFLNPESLHDFEARLPSSYFAGMLRSRIIFRDWMLAPLSTWYLWIYLVSMLALVLFWVSWPWIGVHRKVNFFPQREWNYVLTIIIVAIVSNAAICGILSGPASRYQTRISWVPLFFLSLIVATFWENRNSQLRTRAHARGDLSGQSRPSTGHT